MAPQTMIVAAVEGGGTSFKVAVCEVVLSEDGSHHRRRSSTNAAPQRLRVLARTTVDSSHDNPQQTLTECAQFLRKHKLLAMDREESASGRYYTALGIATFGPVGLHPSDPATYGRILPTTPKPAWRDVDLLTPLRQACANDDNDGQDVALQVRIETDVNAPAWAEYQEILSASADAHHNHRRRISSLAYITVGTGIGVGLVVNGQCVHGRMHPEGGHVVVQPLPRSDGDDKTNFTGYSWGTQHCPYHGQHTVEGVASSVALTERLAQRSDASKTATETLLDRSILATLSDEDEIWDHAANALANLCTNLLLTLSIERIVLGGGLMKRHVLLAKIQKRTYALLNGYLGDQLDLEHTITLSPHHGDDAGLHGAMILAQDAALATLEDDSDKDEETKQTHLKLTAFKRGFQIGLATGVVLMALAVRYVVWPAATGRSRSPPSSRR